jgi:hypothetical protein
MSTLNTAYPTSLDTVQTLLQVLNNFATTLTSNINDSQTTIQVSSVAGLPAPGTISIDGEVIYYGSTQIVGLTHQLLSCVRGFDSTTASAHLGAARVEQRWVAVHHNLIAGAIAAIQLELGAIPSDTYDDVATRLTKNLPSTVAFSPATTNWSFTHDRRRLVGVQLYRKIATNDYELFEANIEQLVNSSGTSTVTITLGATEEGYALIW